MSFRAEFLIIWKIINAFNKSERKSLHLLAGNTVLLPNISPARDDIINFTIFKCSSKVSNTKYRGKIQEEDKE